MLIESFSGIRGIYGKDLNEDIARKYAFCYSQFLKKRNKKPIVVIGMDTRSSCKALKGAIIDGLDCDVIDVGIATTPAAEFAVRNSKADGGVVITASHNEPEWNGFKFLNKDGAVLRPRDIEIIISDFNKIKNLNEIDFLKKCIGSNKIKIKKIIKKNITEDYSNFLLKIIGKKNIDLIKKSKFKVIIDPNGGTAFIAKGILEKIGVNIIGINMERGKFKRMIEPNEESLSYLQEITKEKNADLAAGFDCDGDRMQIMLHEGIVNGHYLLALAVDEVLSNLKNPEKANIVTNDATSGVVREVVKKYNARVEEAEVGEINVVDMMENLNSPVGGEGSSAGVILPPSKCRDGILTLLLVLSIIAKKSKSLAEIIKSYPRYYTLTEKIKFNPEQHDEIKRKIKDYYTKKGFKTQETGVIKGGLKILIDENSFVWFRASKTEEGIFRIMADSKDLGKGKELIKESKEFFQKNL